MLLLFTNFTLFQLFNSNLQLTGFVIAYNVSFIFSTHIYYFYFLFCVDVILVRGFFYFVVDIIVQIVDNVDGNLILSIKDMK